MEQGLMTIREMCEMFDVTPRTLRFYEAKELLSPERDGQKRLFTKRDRARMKLIQRGKRYGFSLEELRQVLELYDLDRSAGAQIARASEIGHRRLAELKAQRDELSAAVRDLTIDLEQAAQFLASQGQRAAE